MSSRTITTFARSLVLVSSALLFHMGAAAAASSVDDMLEQQRALLAGKTATVSAPSSAQRSVGEERSTGDAQDFARRLLLGVTPGQLHPAASRVSGDRVYGDAQVLARQLLLGARGAPLAGSRLHLKPPATGRAADECQHRQVGSLSRHARQDSHWMSGASVL